MHLQTTVHCQVMQTRRRTGRGVAVDYAALVGSRSRARRRLVLDNGDNNVTVTNTSTTDSTNQEIATNNVEEEEETTQAPAETRRTPRRARPRRSRTSIDQINTSPPLKEGEVECRACKMRFADPAGASQKHNRHHPDCALFDRNTPWNDAERLCNVTNIECAFYTVCVCIFL